MSTTNTTNLPCVLATGQTGNASVVVSSPIPGLPPAGLCPIVAGDAAFAIGTSALSVKEGGGGYDHTTTNTGETAVMAERASIAAFVHFSVPVGQTRMSVVTPTIRAMLGHGSAHQLPPFLQHLHGGSTLLPASSNTDGSEHAGRKLLVAVSELPTYSMDGGMSMTSNETAVPPPPGSPTPFGDADGDGRFDVTDLLFAQVRLSQPLHPCHTP